MKDGQAQSTTKPFKPLFYQSSGIYPTFPTLFLNRNAQVPYRKTTIKIINFQKQYYVYLKHMTSLSDKVKWIDSKQNKPKR